MVFLAELIQLAIEQGSVTPREIADVHGSDGLPIEYERELAVGME